MEVKHSGGIGLFGLMFIVMFALKLAGVINISWWLVTAPLWAPFLVAIAFIVGAAIIATAGRSRGGRF